MDDYKESEAIEAFQNYCKETEISFTKELDKRSSNGKYKYPLTDTIAFLKYIFVGMFLPATCVRKYFLSRQDVELPGNIIVCTAIPLIAIFIMSFVLATMFNNEHLIPIIVVTFAILYQIDCAYVYAFLKTNKDALLADLERT